MITLGGSRRGKNSFDIINDPDALKASIEAHNKSIEARNKSADEHKQARAEALDALEKLKQKQTLNDEREHTLDLRDKICADLGSRLNSQIADYEWKQRQLDESKAEHEKRIKENELLFQRMTHDILAKDEAAEQRRKDLDQKYLEVSKKNQELSRREAMILQREATIIEFADNLRGE